MDLQTNMNPETKEVLSKDIVEKHPEKYEEFVKIRAAYDELDKEGLSIGKLPMHSTAYGFWGTTNLSDAFEIFTRIKLERFKFLGDLGAGDGRIIAVASLFTKTEGIEGDKKLVDKGQDILKQLDNNAELVCDNYYNTDFSKFDIIFMFPDNRFDETMISKLENEFKGFLLVYNDTHNPNATNPGNKKIRKGKTYWVRQMPIVSYAINTEDKNLELE